ncbi:hypothetical protein GOV14_05935 [Candidatus Pacearchaeota archaeon]|nr:hypothetical protein [Candidatus Pacearchaeota archaeon]
MQEGAGFKKNNGKDLIISVAVALVIILILLGLFIGILALINEDDEDTANATNNTTNNVTSNASMSLLTGSGRGEGSAPKPSCINGVCEESFECKLLVNCFHVSDLGSGTLDGGNWSNAMNGLPDVLVRGATYYIADGIYSAYDFNDAEDGQYITIKKAIKSDHGSDVGWVDGLGNEQAIWLMKTTSDRLRFSTGNYIIDGQIGGGPGDWYGTNNDLGNFGFKITGAYKDISSDTPLVQLMSPGTNDNIEIKHVYFKPAVNDKVYGKDYGIYNVIAGNALGDGLTYVGPENFKLSYSRFGKFHVHVSGTSIKNWLLEYNLFEATRDDSFAQSLDVSYEANTLLTSGGLEDYTIRYNLFKDNSGTSAIMHKIDQLGNPGRRLKNNKIYGNVFYQTSDRIQGLTLGVVSVANLEPVDTWDNEITGNARIGPGNLYAGYMWNNNFKGHISKMRLSVQDVNIPGTFRAQMYTNNVSSPGVPYGNLSEVVDITNTGMAEFVFSTPVLVNSGTNYWMVFYSEGTGDADFNSVDYVAGVSSGLNSIVTSITDNLPEDCVWKVDLEAFVYVHGIEIYNNAFVGLNRGDYPGGQSFGFDLQGSDLGENYAYNNLWYNVQQSNACDNENLIFANIVHDSNWFYDVDCTGAGIESAEVLKSWEINGQLGAGNPFIDWQAEDFNLIEAIPGLDNFGAPYNLDMFGNVRGSDGVWDRGAVEYDKNA